MFDRGGRLHFVRAFAHTSAKAKKSAGAGKKTSVKTPKQRAQKKRREFVLFSPFLDHTGSLIPEPKTPKPLGKGKSKVMNKVDVRYK